MNVGEQIDCKKRKERIIQGRSVTENALEPAARKFREQEGEDGERRTVVVQKVELGDRRLPPDLGTLYQVPLPRFESRRASLSSTNLVPHGHHPHVLEVCIPPDRLHANVGNGRAVRSVGGHGNVVGSRGVRVAGSGRGRGRDDGVRRVRLGVGKVVGI